MLKSRQSTLFAILLVACVLGTAVAIVAAVRGAQVRVAASARARDALGAAAAAHRSALLFSDAGHRGQVVVRAGAGPLASGLRCDRVAFAGGRGICLRRGGGFAAGAQVAVFGRDLRVRRQLTVAGIPSRARVSPDGRYGSVTLFVSGHAYSSPGSFSTQTTLIDLAHGAKIADLEQFTTFRGDTQVTATDVNYWGVTFARDSDRFYATMATGGRTYLIEGSVSARRARVLRENVECPSLSPDGTRIAFKERTGSAEVPWRLTVLDLATMRATHLAERRSVDDQAEWLDGTHVLYGAGGAIWEIPADGTGSPRRVQAHAASPAAVRAD